MDMLVSCIITGGGLLLLFLNILALGLCRSARDADRRAAEHFASLERQYKNQVRDDLKKKRLSKCGE